MLLKIGVLYEYNCFVLVTLDHMVVENKKRRISIKSNQTTAGFPVVQLRNFDEL